MAVPDVSFPVQNFPMNFFASGGGLLVVVVPINAPHLFHQFISIRQMSSEYMSNVICQLFVLVYRYLYQSTTSAGLRSVSQKAARPILWNELPLTLKRMTSSFKCNIKKYLLSLY